MIKPADWNTVQANDGAREQITPGGHICVIKAARPDRTRTGKELFVLFLELADGQPTDGMIGREYARRRESKPDAQWPVSGQYRQLTQDSNGGTNPYFKGLIKSIEDSNNGFVWDFNEASLKGKKIGMIFREEEYFDANYNVRTSVKPVWARSVATIERGVEVPECKRLPGTPAAPAAAPAAFAQTAFTPADEEDLPF